MTELEDNSPTSTNKQCTNCGNQFTCNVDDIIGCWCADFSPIFSVNMQADCLCPDCLKNKTINKINEYTNALTPEDILNNKVKDLPKTKNLLEGIDYYIENGLYVFTTWYHLKRGFCCNNNCRHCPYKMK